MPTTRPRPVARATRRAALPRAATLAALLALLAFAFAPPLPAQELAAYGVLRDASDFVPPCVLFESDAGLLARLDELGGLAVGQRVYVEGSVSGVAVCGGLIVTRLDNTITPAFAGTGVLRAAPDGTPELRADEGQLYALTNDGGFATGARVFLQGRVVGGTAARPLVAPDTLGPGFAAFGRLVPAASPSGAGLQTDAGLVGLERLGIGLPVQGQAVFVEGVLPPGNVTLRGVAAGDATPGGGASGAGGGPTPGGGPGAPGGAPQVEPDGAASRPAPPVVRGNIVSPAAFFAGEVVDTPEGLRVKAEAQHFDDLYALPDTRGLEPGARIFVRGRALTDFDPLEDPTSRVIRRARTGPAFSACGVFLSAPGEPPVLQTLDGELLALQNPVEYQLTGPLPHGALRYVVGRLEPLPDGGLRLADNVILPCVILSGQLEQGFECSPLFVASDTGDVFNIEDPPAIPLGDPFTVTAGVNACGQLCPFPCLLVEELVEG